MIGSASLLGYGIYDGNEVVYNRFIMPIIHKTMDGENAHNLAIIMAKHGFLPKNKEIRNEKILVL